MDEISLHLPAKPDYLIIATALSRKICLNIKNDKINKDFVDAIELVVSEACTNVIRHSANGKLMLKFNIYGGGLSIMVKDQGEGFDFQKIQPPDMDKHPESGYGIYIIKAKMDEVKYTKTKNWNILSMTKYF